MRLVFWIVVVLVGVGLLGLAFFLQTGGKRSERSIGGGPDTGSTKPDAEFLEEADTTSLGPILAMPPSIESILVVDFRKEEQHPWLSILRPKPDRAAQWGIPGLPKALLQKLLDAGIDRLTRGARGFRPAATRTGGYREEVRIIESSRSLSAFQDGLESNAEEEKAKLGTSYGRLFRVFSPEDKKVWIGLAEDRTCVISSQEDLAWDTLSRLGEWKGGRPPRPALERVSRRASFDVPVLVLREYDPENRRDIFSPLHPPRGDDVPQGGPFLVMGIRLVLDGKEAPVADLVVLTNEHDKARAFYTDLLGFETRLEEASPSGPGFMRLGFRPEEGKESRFWFRVFLLFGYQLN